MQESDVSNKKITLKLSETTFQKLKKLCDEKRITLKGFFEEGSTIIKQRVIAHGQQIVRLDFGENELKKIGQDIQDQIINSLEKEIGGYDFIILSDYNKSFFNENFSEKIINLANSEGVRSLVDPKPPNFNFFKRCTVICPNRYEAEEITEPVKNKNKALVFPEMSAFTLVRFGKTIPAV